MGTVTQLLLHPVIGGAGSGADLLQGPFEPDNLLILDAEG